MARGIKKPSFGDILANDPPARERPVAPSSPRGKSLKRQRAFSIPGPALTVLFLGGALLLLAQASLSLENRAADGGKSLIIPKEHESCRRSEAAMRDCYPYTAKARRAIMGSGQQSAMGDRLPQSYANPDELLAEANGQ